MPAFQIDVRLLWGFLLFYTVQAQPPLCLGEFQHCTRTAECTLFECDGVSPHCASGEYRCPISNTCVKGAEGYMSCPGLNGTHLDHSLSVEKRVQLLLKANKITQINPTLTHNL